MAETKISCEHCGQCIAFDDSYRGLQIDCPSCQRVIFVPASKQIRGANNFVSFAATMILLWPVLGIIVEFICTGLYEWKTGMAEILGFWFLWISAGIGIYFCGKLFSKAAASSQSLKNVSETFTTDFEKKFPKLPWGSIGGITVLVMVLIRHWDGVSHFFTNAIHTSHSLSVGSLVPDSLKQITANGTVYVKLRSGESVSLSMVKVAAYADEFISNKVAILNGDITQERQSSPPMSGKQIADETRIKTLLALNNGSLNLWAGAVATAVTDKDGKYSMTLPHTGHYSFFALTGREIPAGNERYIFFRRGNLDASFSDYTIDLNNSYEEVSKYTEGWTDDTRNSFDDMSLWQCVIGWIMTKEFGLINISQY